MDTLSYKTLAVGPEAKQHEWLVIDATDQHLGRLCSKVAKILRGKYKPGYCPYMECGDNVIIINADKVKLTGKKMTDKIYLNFTGYPGGQRELTPEVLMKKSPAISPPPLKKQSAFVIINTKTNALKEIIADHTKKILQENEGQLMKKGNVGHRYTVNL